MKCAGHQLSAAFLDGQWVESGEEVFGFPRGAPGAQHRPGCRRHSINVC